MPATPRILSRPALHSMLAVGGTGDGRATVLNPQLPGRIYNERWFFIPSPPMPDVHGDITLTDRLRQIDGPWHVFTRSGIPNRTCMHSA